MAELCDEVEAPPALAEMLLLEPPSLAPVDSSGSYPSKETRQPAMHVANAATPIPRHGVGASAMLTRAV